MKNGDLRRTDLAAELRVEGAEEETGIRFTEEKRGAVTVSRLSVLNARGEKAIGRPVGRYDSVCFGQVWLDGAEEREEKEKILASLLREFTGEAKNALAVCLGNRAVTPDALGPLVMDRLRATAHLPAAGFGETACGALLSAFAPGVVGQTGIETACLVKGAAGCAAPEVILAIDALASSDPDRLCTTVQLCDTGIRPGSGIGNRRSALDRETLGAPVIAIGVPTAADLSALVLGALEEAGEEPSDALLSVLRQRGGLFVSRKETDEALDVYASLIAGAINRLFSCFGDGAHRMS